MMIQEGLELSFVIANTRASSLQRDTRQGQGVPSR